MHQDADIKQSPSGARLRSRVIVAILMIVFGLAEVAKGFTHHFFGLTTSQAIVSTYLGVALGLFYLISGILILSSSRKWAAVSAITLLCADVVGRIAMVLTGLYPVNSFLQSLAIVIGTAIAAFLAVFIGLHLKFFR